ncbi:DUF624 domain-containing protein [Amycolatopsis sp. SID8362]|uniref:DUF624 domain-containing protein n=1 Tax=Amycolatopsis sp. SID8362 TaxID=2690346 RepID=UPI00136BD0A5|nr:DUF624 domain-containing protein [Amycolatopsis sp. SID8362]NBH08210.1 DUF624 domain-containing protein [Amycolatopsis sp. SID8362]NED44904.1 DUF624 domain-containing protein [Amycolatopsis sp. SID8362]
MREATWRAGLGEFSDCLLAGLLVAVASVPVVTAAPALVAGCRAVERARRGVGGPLWTTFWADFRSVFRGGVLFGLGCVAAVVVFAVDLEVAGSLPGAGLVRPVLGVLAGVAVVLAVRTCEFVSSGALSWHRATLAAAREVAASPGSAALLAAAIGLSAVLVWMLPILAFIVAGPLCLAAVATGGRS